MTPEKATDGFAAMGSTSRLTVLQTLVRAGEGGLYVGEIQERTGIPASTLTHHLKFLTLAGLITQEKLGRSILCRAEYDHLKDLAAYILSECCSDAALPRQHEEENRSAI